MSDPMDYRDFVIPLKKMRSILDSSMNRTLKDKDFTASQVPFIMEIGENEGISMKNLSTALGVDKGFTTRVVRVLIDNGFVENRGESSRTYRLYLTEKGKEAFDLSTTTLDQALGQIFECLNDEDINNLRKISAKMNKRLDELYKY